MATLRKISDSTFDLNRRILIAGKGPSISKVDDFLKDKNLDDFYFCAVNSAYQYLPRVDFLSFCDLGAVEKLDELGGELAYRRFGIKSLVCPLVLRSDSTALWATMSTKPFPGAFETNKTYKWLSEHLKGVDVNIYNYHLYTQEAGLQKDENVDDFLLAGTFDGGPITSSYQCGLAWLAEAGFRSFEVFGVSEKREYGELFVKNDDCGNDRPDDWYKANFEKGECIFRAFECSNVYH